MFIGANRGGRTKVRGLSNFRNADGFSPNSQNPSRSAVGVSRSRSRRERRMVLAAATSLIVEYIPASKYLVYGASISALYAVRYWAGGYRSRETRDLHNKTFILVVRALFAESLRMPRADFDIRRERSLVQDSPSSTPSPVVELKSLPSIKIRRRR